MLDRQWSGPLDLTGLAQSWAGWTLHSVDPGPMSLLLGRWETALPVGLAAAVQGWPGQAQGGLYAVRLGLDRVLLVGKALPQGWQGTYGCTTASDAFCSLELRGPQWPQALASLGDMRLERPSASAVFLVLVCRVVMYRHGEHLRLHVPQAQAQAFVGLLGQVWAEHH